MWLINTETLKLEEFIGRKIPPYAILSHTWQGREVTLQEYRDYTKDGSPPAQGRRYDKIHHTSRLARERRIGYCWIDTCCIDKTSSAELAEAINSMYGWYERAEVCFAHLSDLAPAPDPIVSTGSTDSTDANGTCDPQPGQDNPMATGDASHPALSDCRWFTRGWTLQELIASKHIQFYDSSWKARGTKKEHASLLQLITGVDLSVLLDARNLRNVPIACRMSWAARRETTRVEDVAYSLMGIFDVQMPLLYGEGEKAFLRLQEEIIKTTNDLTLFAWRAKERTQGSRGCLATSPAEFEGSGDIVTPHHQGLIGQEFAMTNKGLRIKTRLHPGSLGRHLMRLNCRKAAAPMGQQICISLKMHGHQLYARERADAFQLLTNDELDDRATMEREGTVYILRNVDPVLSQHLNSSHRHALVFRGGFENRRRIRLVEPAQLYDPNRALVLTGGATPFVGSVQVAIGSSGDIRGSAASGASGTSANGGAPYLEIIFGIEAPTGNELARGWVDMVWLRSKDAQRLRRHPSGKSVATLTAEGIKATVTMRKENFEGEMAYLIDLIVRG